MPVSCASTWPCSWAQAVNVTSGKSRLSHTGHRTGWKSPPTSSIGPQIFSSHCYDSMSHRFNRQRSYSTCHRVCTGRQSQSQSPTTWPSSGRNKRAPIMMMMVRRGCKALILFIMATFTIHFTSISREFSPASRRAVARIPPADVGAQPLVLCSRSFGCLCLSVSGIKLLSLGCRVCIFSPRRRPLLVHLRGLNEIN